MHALKYKRWEESFLYYNRRPLSILSEYLCLYKNAHDFFYVYLTTYVLIESSKFAFYATLCIRRTACLFFLILKNHPKKNIMNYSKLTVKLFICFGCRKKNHPLKVLFRGDLHLTTPYVFIIDTISIYFLC